MDNVKIVFLDGVYKGSSYEGEVLNGKFHGYGVLYNKEGHKFEGNWKNGLRHGVGKYTYKSSESYEGGYQNGIRDGFGVYTYKNGDEEHGLWVGGNPHGEHEYVKVSTDGYDMTTPLRLTRRWRQGNLSNNTFFSSLRHFFRST